MVDLVQWLTAQLDADAARAQACPGDGEWRADDIAVYGSGLSPEVREHMAEHDPARVLREIDAKRKLVELHRPIPDPTPPFKDVDGFLCSVCTAGGAMYDQNRGVLFTDLTVFPCQTLRLLALPYSDRDGYREEWAP